MEGKGREWEGGKEGGRKEGKMSTLNRLKGNAKVVA